MRTEQINVLLADDFDLIRQGLKRIIDYEEDINVIGEADNGDKVLSMMEVYKPDVLILDMNMPKKSGLEVLKIIRQKDIDVKIIILTIEDDQRIIKEVINIGADGYILKDSVAKEIVNAIHIVYNGGNYIDQSLVSVLFKDICNKEESNIFDKLSKREIEILYYISKGKSNKEIGSALFISEKTVKNYATKLFKKINVSDRVHATIFAIEHKIEDYYLDKNIGTMTKI